MEKENSRINPPVISVEELTFYYSQQQRAALDCMNFKLQSGEFLLICGASGCGKSTLLRQLKTTLTPSGHRQGAVYFCGTDLNALDHRTQSEKIGFVQQSPDNQIVTDKVWHELAFGLESLGYDTPTIRRRVAEMASFFGIQSWFHQDVSQLSGGQKQLLNLASIMVMQPQLLILDEPTSQLDPIAATEFFATLQKINRELGTTIILTEHRLEEALPLANRVIVMESGRVMADGAPRVVGEWLKMNRHPMYLAMPTPMRVWSEVVGGGECPLTVAEGRTWLDTYAKQNPIQEIQYITHTKTDVAPVVAARDVWFRYEQDSQDIVRGLSFQVQQGEFLALLGGNGTGKTTTLRILSGLQHPQRGEVSVVGQVTMLPQNPQALFVKKTVREDLFEVFEGSDTTQAIQNQTVGKWVNICRLEGLLDRHPYDLSGGEQQRAALCKVLLLAPNILLLDEPTKGLDGEFKTELAQILRKLCQDNVTILMVSHDVEFCAQYATQCALFFDGAVVTQDNPKAFFTGNRFYTTAANRMSRGVVDGVVTAEELCTALGVPASCDKQKSLFEEYSAVAPKLPTEKLSIWRRWIAGISALVAFMLLIQVISVTDLSAFVTQTGISQLGQGSMAQNIGLILFLVIFALAMGRRKQMISSVTTWNTGNEKLTKRTFIAIWLILLLIPLTLYIGATYWGGRQYYFIALLVLFQCMIPFFLVFEGRRPQARELVTIAVLCAIAVAGRAVFFMLPQFKPVIAICVVAGIGLGSEVGFLVGAMSMLASNVLFSQGPWTPWQMFAMGIIGFLAGLLFRPGALRPTRISMSLFGLLSAVLVYGGIMNGSSMLLWATQWNLKLFLTYYLTGFPMDVIHGLATAIFLWFIGESMLEKLERLKMKYGMIQ